MLGGETLTCVVAVPVGCAFDLADTPEFVPAEATEQKVVAGLADFIRGVLIDEDVARFEKAIRNRADPVEGADLYAVVEYLAEAYAGRPTSPSGGSSRGRRTAGRSSNGGRSVKASGRSPK